MVGRAETKRLLKYLTLKGLASPEDKIEKLSSQGLSGEVYSLNSGGKEFIIKFYRKGDWKTAAKEKQMYQILSQHNVPVPKVYLTDPKGKIAGNPFIMMQRIRGESFSKILKQGKEREFVKALALSLHRLHSINIKDLKLNLPAKRFNDEISDLKILAGVLLPFSTAIRKFNKTYKLIAELSAYNVEGNPPALLHGDCAPENVVYSNGLVYLIDLEGMYVGDPAYDLGYAYHALRIGAFSRPELADYLIEIYEKIHGKIRNLDVYKRLAALKTAVLIEFLRSFNPFSLFFIGFKRAMNFIAGQGRKFMKFIANYSLTYAERGYYPGIHRNKNY